MRLLADHCQGLFLTGVGSLGSPLRLHWGF
jgi:hypothetical protein